MEAPAEARADWRIMAQVAQAMGFGGFDYSGPSKFFAEHVALTQLNNNGTRKLHLANWQGREYDQLPPEQWGGARPFADAKFQTASIKSRFVATPFVSLPAQDFTLNTGRIRDQWHTMTRTGLMPRLFGHRAEPYVEINPLDAIALGLGATDLVEISGPQGKALARAVITDGAKSGEIFIPMHWSGSFAANSLANAMTTETVDPLSGQPALKSSAVTITKFPAA